ncbi:MAG TPA: DNRLRE domain-containing protein, partial [Anaerolineae bacterium]|nr:DNRLRE domain-containing protein [Anaerolineae bacterium]
FPVALVRGLGFLDDSVLPGDPTAHTYQVEAVMAHGTESVGTVTVHNQGATPLTPPATVTATALISPALRRSPDWVLAQQNRKAHGRIFLLWSLPQAPAGQPTPDRWVTSYDIFRAGPVGPGDDPGAMRYDQINEEPVAPMADYDPPSPVAGDVYTVPYQHYPYYFADADAALQPCQTYAYRVAPRDLLGQVAQTSGYVTATVPDAMPPEPPTLLTPTVNHLGGEIAVAWQPVSDAVRYRLYRSDTPTAGWPGLTNCAVYSCWMTMTTTAGTSWVDSSALYEHRYWYVVRAEDQPCPGDPPNLSAPSNAVSAVLHDRVPPGPPTNISVTEADIRWTPDPDTDYSLLYCSFDDDPGDGQEPEKVLIAEVPSTTVHFDLASFYTAPVPVDTRCWLQPLDAHGNAGDLTLLTQSPVDICQSSVVYTLTAPVILSLTTQAGGVYSWTAAVSWDMADDLPRLQGFHVYRQEGGAARQDISGPLSPQTRRFEDLTVKPGFLYTYTVAAVLAPGCAQEFPRYVFSSPRLFRVNPTLDCCSRSVRDLVWLQHGFTPGGGTYLQWSDPQGYTMDKPVLAIVYRSLKVDGDYVAITSPFVTHTNEYLDRDAEHGEYWYVVTMLDWASGEIIAQTPPWSAQSLAPLPGPTAFRSAPPAALPAAPFGPAGAGRPSALGPAAVNDVTVLAPAADTFVARGSPDTNFGSSSQLSLTDSTEVLASRYVLLRFDLSSIPAGSIIDSADLGLDLQDVGTGTVPVGLRRVTNSWVENEVTWNSQPAVDGVYVTTTVGLTTGWYTWTVTNLVQQWVYTPTTYPNYGLQLRGPAGDYEKTFSSREGSQPPRLRVGYFAPPQTLFFGVQGDNLFEVTNVTYDAGSTPWCLSGSGQVALGGPPLSTFTRTVTFSCIQAGFGDGIVTQGTATVTLSGPLQIVYPGGHVYTVTSLYMNEQTGWGDIDLVIPAATVLHHGGSAYRHVTLSPAETVRQNLTYEAHRDWTSACSQPTPTYYFEMNPLPLRIVPLGPVTFTQQTIEMGSACTQYEERYAQSRPPYPLADANDGYLRVVYTSTAAVHLFGDGVAGAFQTGEPISYTTAMPYGFEIEAADGATFEIMGNRIDNGMLLNISLAFDYYGKPAPETLTGGGISVPAPDQRFVGAADHLNIEADGALSGTIDAGANPPWPIQWAGGGFVLQERYYQLYLPPIQTAADRLPAEEAAANRPGNANIQAGLNLVGADVAFTWYHCKGACGAGATAISFPEGVSADIYVRRGGVSDHIDAVISPGSGVPVLLYGYQHTLKRFQLSFCDNYIYDSGVEADLYLPFPSAMTVPLVEMQIDPNTACMEGGRVRGDANPLTPAYWQVDIHARGVAYRPSGQCNRYLWILGAVDIPHLAPPGAQGASPVPLEISFNPDGTFHDTKIVYNKAGYKFDGFSYLLSQVRLSDYSQREQPAWTAAATLSDPPSSSVWQNHGFVELKGKTLTPVFGEIKGKGGQASPRLFVLGWDEYVGFAQQPTVQRTWTALTDITWRFDLIYAQHVVTTTPRGAF